MYRVIAQKNGNEDESVFSEGDMIDNREKAIDFIKNSMVGENTFSRFDLHFCINNDNYGPCIWAIEHKNHKYQEDKTQKDLILMNRINEFASYTRKKWKVRNLDAIVSKDGQHQTILSIPVL